MAALFFETTGEKKMDQSRTPLLEMLERFRIKNRGYFNIPAHHLEDGISGRAREVIGEKVFGIDVTETDGTDDLHCPEDGIREAQQLAAELYGADRSWFLVNGTTCGNEAMILSVAGPGEKIIVSRDAHKSALMGLILSGASPVWAYPTFREYDSMGDSAHFSGTSQKPPKTSDCEIPTAMICPEMIERLLRENPDVKGVFLTSPSYYGICQPLAELAVICHRYQVPLLVDEAHGGHLRFHEKLPMDALACGADMVVQSTHKTCGSLTQTSMLHLHSALVSAKRVDQCLKMVQSTSPSYVLMASLDAARQQMAIEGHALMEKALERAASLRSALAEIPGVYVLSENTACRQLVLDPLRVTFAIRHPAMDGFGLQEALFQRGITTELADLQYVLAIISWGTPQEEIEHLTEAVREIAASLPPINDGAYGSSKQKKLLKIAKGIFDPTGKMKYTPRQAWYMPKKRVSPEEAIGAVAGEMIVPYPPGIPAIFPGEVISAEIVTYIRELMEAGGSFHGLENLRDPRLEIIRES